jgi:small multidrug resistance pump
MSTKILFWIFTIFGVILEISGDIFFKKWVILNRPFLLWVGFGVYAVGVLFWALSLKYEVLSKAISIFTILNLVIVAVIGVLFFKEDISIVSKIDILLRIISIALIELG